jgi:hypothetical protein
MDCSNARLLMQFRTTNGDELAAPEREELDAHLAGCPLCRAVDHDQQRLDDHLGRAMRDVPVPAGLRQRLLAAVAPAAPAKRPRRWLKRASWGLGLATAASLGLLVWGWYFWRGPLRPSISPHHVQMGYIASPPRDAAAVNDAFRLLGARRCAPDWANYNYLTSAPALAVLPGHWGQEEKVKIKVPHLVFTHKNDTVLMFIIPNREYRVEDLDQGGSYDYNLDKQTSEGSADTGYTYLILYKGRYWDWIKRADADK